MSFQLLWIVILLIIHGSNLITKYLYLTVAISIQIMIVMYYMISYIHLRTQ